MKTRQATRNVQYALRGQRRPKTFPCSSVYACGVRDGAVCAPSARLSLVIAPVALHARHLQAARAADRSEAGDKTSGDALAVFLGAAIPCGRGTMYESKHFTCVRARRDRKPYWHKSLLQPMLDTGFIKTAQTRLCHQQKEKDPTSRHKNPLSPSLHVPPAGASRDDPHGCEPRIRGGSMLISQTAPPPALPKAVSAAGGGTAAATSDVKKIVSHSHLPALRERYACP